ncbi:F-box domain protein [Dictyocaulus viviparus]|uniref:F-box domain protein n=1 Tax=Dictyocaulus viviparus TaxID=29172 RepID=A0A0D8Y061_DICVI|nr:F-box domain protein [Dictyocaulus viviparus]
MKQASYGTKCFMELPNEIQIAILKHLTYDDIAKLRRTCKLMNTLCSYLLNRGFQQLGIDIDKEKLRIKRELPRRESMRRKFIDIKATCFIPGKASLACLFNYHVVIIFTPPISNNSTLTLILLQKSHDRGGTLTIDIHELLKDLRDLSRYMLYNKVFSNQTNVDCTLGNNSMAMEHFEEHVQPSLSSTTNASLSSTYFMSVHPLYRPSSAKALSLPSDGCEWRKNIIDKLAQQDKVIRKQTSEIMSLKSCIRQLVAVCTQLSTSMPSQEQEISNLLDVVLDTISLECPIVYYEEPSTSSRNGIEKLFSCGRKRNYSDDDSREYNVEKRTRRNDECPRERLI